MVFYLFVTEREVLAIAFSFYCPIVLVFFIIKSFKHHFVCIWHTLYSVCSVYSLQTG
jgi:hypothetical protein